ncbi:MAG: HAMP domain-containing sensor histidine kinase [Actinomycetota bacterium]|nr:HAMP domain-containing sensor histidine kinase [Actinomycetota bacterium]
MARLRLPRLANRWRITGWIVVSVLAVTFVVGFVAVLGVRSRFTDQIDEELRAQARNIPVALAVLDDEQLARLADVPSFGDNTYAVTVIGPDGEVIELLAGGPVAVAPAIDTSPRAVSSLRGRAGEPFDLASTDGSVTYRAMVGQLDDGGIIVVTRPLDDREDAVKAVVSVLLVAGAVAAVLISATVAVVTSLVTRPLDAMIDAAEAIGDGDLTSRVPATGVEDVSRLATALNLMLDRLERAFDDKAASEDALRRFVADASHELRTPLAAVLGYVDLYQSGMVPPDRVDHSMERIRAEGERMRLIVEELLTLARLDEGRAVESAPVDVAQLARDAVADAGAVEPTRPLTLDVDVEGEVGRVTVRGDAMSLRQAIDNLLANARAHTPPSAPVTLTVERTGGSVVVTVADEGPGMEPEVADHVFERFYRADKSRSRPGGSGLGLAIVAAIADAHGGDASVSSMPGAGSTFTIRLPAEGTGAASSPPEVAMSAAPPDA